MLLRQLSAGLSPPELRSPANPIWQKCLMPLGPESVVKCDVPLLNYLFFWILAYASYFLFERDKTGCWVCPGRGRGGEARKTVASNIKHQHNLRALFGKNLTFE